MCCHFRNAMHRLGIICGFSMKHKILTAKPWCGALLEQVCKHFLDAVEKKQYGWFWVCPNGGKECHYRHALPPGYVLKSQMKALLEEEADKITIEETIENERSKVKSVTPLTPELFAEWKRKKISEREEKLAAKRAERAKDDRMSGRELFASDASLFVDDVEAYDNYARDKEELDEAPVQSSARSIDDEGGPSTSQATQAMSDEDDIFDDDDDELDPAELDELEASISKASMDIR
eukprot:c15184_g2_i1 orf=92-796(+)